MELLNTCADICRQCHNAVHNLIDNKTLAQSFNTVDKLMAHEGIRKAVAYVSRQATRTKAQTLNPLLRFSK